MEEAFERGRKSFPVKPVADVFVLFSFKIPKQKNCDVHRAAG